MNIIDLIGNFHKWTTEVVKNRLETGTVGLRDWVYKSLGFDKTLSTEDYQTFFDRTALNDIYEQIYLEEDLNKKEPGAWHQTEINAIYSFHKCFAMRNFTRLQYYIITSRC